MDMSDEHVRRGIPDLQIGGHHSCWDQCARAFPWAQQSCTSLCSLPPDTVATKQKPSQSADQSGLICSKMHQNIDNAEQR